MRTQNIIAAALSLGLMGLLVTAGVAHADPNSSDLVSEETGHQWSAQAALERARGALDRADRAQAMKYEFETAREAWAAYQSAREALRAGDYHYAEVQARAAAKLASTATRLSLDNTVDEAIDEQKRRLMTDVIAETTVVPLVTNDGIEFTYEGLFVPTTATLSPEGERMVVLMAKVAANYPTFRLVVEGYAPQTGDPTSALTTAQRRAIAIVDALESMGVATRRLSSTVNDEPYSLANDGADFVFVAPTSYLVQ